MSSQEPSLCGFGALLGLILLPAGKPALGQMPAENGSGIGVVADLRRGHKGEAGSDRALRLLKVIPVPGTADNVTNGKLYSFDISWVDQVTQTYYLADRSNKRVDVVDAKTGTFIGGIPGGFKGVAVVNGVVQSGQSGPNAVVTGGHCLFVTDAPSRVVSFDLTASFPPPVVNAVSTGGADSFRADELAYDPKGGLLLVI